MRKVLWFLLGVLLFCAAAQLAYGQIDVSKLPSEVGEHFTLEKAEEYPFAAYIGLLGVDVRETTYYVTYHKQTFQLLSAGYGEVLSNKPMKIWICEGGVWRRATPAEEVEWLRIHDVAKTEV